MTATFVTATGTDIGKTFVTTALIGHLRGQGDAVDALKPVVSGFDPGQLAETAMPAPFSPRSAGPSRSSRPSASRHGAFAAPLSPDMAAERENRSIAFDALTEFCRDAIAAHRDRLFIEGIGGIMVPLDRSHTVLDLITELRLPLLLVAGSYVGTISHTLTALQVLARRNVDVAAVVISESPGSAALLDETVATVARFSEFDRGRWSAAPRRPGAAASRDCAARAVAVRFQARLQPAGPS